jgi:hypothetical protein
MLARRDKILRQTQEINPNSKPGDSQKVQIDVLNELSRQYDFKNCIVNHNLEDDNGNLLNFANPMSLDVLDPKIGAEIEGYIDELNREDFDEQGFTQPSDGYLRNETNQSSNGSDSET